MKITILVATFLAYTSILFAANDYNTALSALKAKDYPEAMRIFEIAAESGDKRADYIIGQMYINGLGVDKDVKKAVTRLEKAASGGVVESKNTLAKIYLGYAGAELKNIDKAREFARESAMSENAEGMYLVFTAFVQDPSLNFIENGKTNVQKYELLRKRNIKERELDVEAYDMLMRSAKRNYYPALALLGITYYESIGDNNNKKALNIIKTSNTQLPAFVQIRKQLEFMNALGSTMTTFKLFADTQASAITAAMIKAYGLERPNECDAKKIKILRANKAGEIEDAVYLPLKEPGMEKAFLVSGKWQEDWTYDVCGKETVIPINFTADGNKGAFFQTETKLNKQN
jgi:hypothetical protein